MTFSGNGNRNGGPKKINAMRIVLGMLMTVPSSDLRSLVPKATCCMFSGSLMNRNASSKRVRFTLSRNTLRLGATRPGPHAAAWARA